MFLFSHIMNNLSVNPYSGRGNGLTLSYPFSC